MGRISLLTLNLRILKEQTHKEKRSVEQYSPNCDDDVHTWGRGSENCSCNFLTPDCIGGGLDSTESYGLLAEQACSSCFPYTE